MTDSCNARGENCAGFLPQLVPPLGAGSFDENPRALRFAHMVTSGAKLGREFVDSWLSMRLKVGEAPAGSGLSPEAADAWRDISRMQAALTRVRERHA